MTQSGESKGIPVSDPKATTGTAMPFRLKKNPRDQSILTALIPGARLDKNTKKILVNTATSNEIITFNVGGSLFQTYKSTLRAIPHTLLANDTFLRRHHRPEQNDYFFDRDPKIFHCILNYLRSGELHLPTSVCGPVVKSELEFWGIEEIEIEECCWSRYSTWSTTLQDLRKLEADRTGNVLQWQIPDSKRMRCRLFNQNAWNFFAEPNSSLAASIYSYVSLSVIFVSIVCFCVQTHEDFQVTRSRLQLNQTTISTMTSFPTQSTVKVVPENLSASATEDFRSPSYYTVSETLPHPALRYVDLICFAFILLELLVRFVVCPKKIRFLFHLMTLIEFLALLPDICFIVFGLAHQSIEYANGILNFMRVFRVFRIFRLMRQIPGLWILIYTLKASVKDLILLLLFLSLGMLIFSSLVFFAEKDVDETKFTSIPMSFWWAVITMTTVGYGDMSPETRMGFLVGTLTAISGLLMIGFTVPVLVNNFVLYYQYTQSAIEREKHRAKQHGRSKRASCNGGEKSKRTKEQQGHHKHDDNGNGIRKKPTSLFRFDMFRQFSNTSEIDVRINSDVNKNDNITKSIVEGSEKDATINNVENSKDLEIILGESDYTPTEDTCTEKDITSL